MPGGRAIWYQKHMAHHLLPKIGRDWLDALTHAFLIREPREMLASLVQERPRRPALADTGLPQQVEIFDRVWRPTRPSAAGGRRPRRAARTRARCSRGSATPGRRVHRRDAVAGAGPRDDRRHLGDVLVRGGRDSTGFGPTARAAESKRRRHCAGCSTNAGALYERLYALRLRA